MAFIKFAQLYFQIYLSFYINTTNYYVAIFTHIHAHCIHSEKVSVYRSLDCLSQDLSIFPFGKKGWLRKKEIIFRVAPLPGRLSSFTSLFSHSKDKGAGRKEWRGGREKGENRGNEWEKRNSIDRDGSKELPMCHWSKWNHRRAFSSATTIRAPIAHRRAQKRRR